MLKLMNSEVMVKSYRIHLMEMVINAIYYNPVRLTSSGLLETQSYFKPKADCFLTGFDPPSIGVKRVDE